MLPTINDQVAWSVGLSPSEPWRKFWSDRDTVCVQDSRGPKKRPTTYSGLLQANTVLCSFNTMLQPLRSFILSIFPSVFLSYGPRVWIKPDDDDIEGDCRWMLVLIGVRTHWALYQMSCIVFFVELICDVSEYIPNRFTPRPPRSSPLFGPIGLGQFHISYTCSAWRW